MAHCSAPGDSVAATPPVPTPSKRELEVRHPPNPAKRNATECSATVSRDRMTVAVEPLRFFGVPSWSVWSGFSSVRLRVMQGLHLENDYFRVALVRFGSVTVRAWNGSSSSGFRFRRFLRGSGFSVF